MEIKLGPSLLCLRLSNYPFGPIEQKISLLFVLVYVPIIIEALSYIILFPHPNKNPMVVSSICKIYLLKKKIIIS